MKRQKMREINRSVTIHDCSSLACVKSLPWEPDVRALLVGPDQTRGVNMRERSS